MAQELLQLQGLCKYYTTAQSVVVGLDKIDLTFCRGEFVAITGESGSGKSTLAHVLAGILPYEGGELLYGGKPTSHYSGGDWEDYRRDKVSFISQSYGILPGNTVLANVTSALRLIGLDKASALRRAEEALKQVELWDLRHRRAAKLSSGQKQRLSIARALARPAPILIADEPTGNLDAENSAKVIDLLAEAAKDRLVILITHEFSECAHCATRHISLHDGHVTMDMPLREPDRPEKREGGTARRSKKGLSLTVAKLQIGARPVWAATMLLLFSLTVFAFFALSGTFLVNLDDHFTRYYNNAAFPNGDSRRIVVIRPDGEELTDGDYAALAGVEFVESVEPWGYVTDVKYAWQEGLDYIIKTSIYAVGGSMDLEFNAMHEYELKPANMSYVKTAPVMPEGKTFLTEGRLPESPYEVVATRDRAQIGDRLMAIFINQKTWGESTQVPFEVTVVGLTDYGNGLFFSKDIGQMFTSDIMYGQIVFPKDRYLTSEMVTFVDALYNIEGFSEKKLTAGRMPASRDEVVIVGGGSDRLSMRSEELLGRTLSVDLSSASWKYASYGLEDGELQSILIECPVLNSHRDFTVVGVVDQSYSHLGTVFLWGDRETLFMTGEEEAQYRTYQADYEALCREYTDFLEEYQRYTILYDQDKTNTAVKTRYAELLTDPFWERVNELKAAYPAAAKTQYNRRNWTIELPLLNDQILISGTLYERSRGSSKERPWAFPVGITTADGVSSTLLCVGAHEAKYNRAYQVNEETYDRLAYHGGSDQASVIMIDYAYTDRVIESLKDLGYVGISPYREGAGSKIPALVEQRMQTLRICVIALLAALILQVVVLRALFSLENETFRLMSNIGLNRISARRSVFWQILAFTLGGELLGVAAISLMGSGGVERVAQLLRYLDTPYRVGLLLVHLCVCMFTAVWVMNAMEKKIYPDPSPTPDLDWDEEEEEVEA